jgi:hypothetical protein
VWEWAGGRGKESKESGRMEGKGKESFYAQRFFSLRAAVVVGERERE